MSNRAIGIFDSGVGGLSVWKEIRKLLPNENLMYLADSKNCPYGSKPPHEIIELSVANTQFLIEKGCKMVVVACNTATASAIDYLRAHFEIPFVGMEPAIKPAALNTATGKIGVLATKGTFEGRLFKETSKKYTSGLDTFVQVGEGLVELVEENKIQTEEALQLVSEYVKPMIEANVDQIVLGCTHYPFLMPLLEKVVPPEVKIIDPAPAVAQRVKTILYEKNLNSEPKTGTSDFFTSGNDSTLKTLLFQLTGTMHTVNKI